MSWLVISVPPALGAVFITVDILPAFKCHAYTGEYDLVLRVDVVVWPDGALPCHSATTLPGAACRRGCAA